MDHSKTGPAVAGAEPCLPSDNHIVRLSPTEYDLAAILDFDPEATIAPGSLVEAWGSELVCQVPVARFSLETWRRLVCGFEDLGGPPLLDDLRVWNFLGRRRAVCSE